jgi:hypothetical protein
VLYKSIVASSLVVEVASGQNGSMGITVDTTVPGPVTGIVGVPYWAAQDGVYRREATDSKRLVSGTDGQFVAINANYLVYTSNGPVRRAEKTTGKNLVDLSGTSGGAGIAIYDNWVYWCAGSSVYRVHITGGPVEEIATGQQNAWGIAVDDDFVYWTNNVQGGAVRKVAR